MHMVVCGDFEQMQHAPGALHSAHSPCLFTLEQAYISALLAVHGEPANQHLATLSKTDTTALNATRRLIFAANERQKAEPADFQRPPENVVRLFTALAAVRERAVEEIARVTSARAQKMGGAG